MKIYDISMDIKEGMIQYPGNPELKIEKTRGSSTTSKVTIGTHCGTHVDSLLHVANEGWSVTDISMDKCYGPCKVLDLTGVEFGNGISVDDLNAAESEFGSEVKEGDIILLKTKNSSTDYKTFKENFVYITEEAARYLVDKKIKTIGVDYLSVQKFRTGYCASHCVFLPNNVLIFEGLKLGMVNAGEYKFVGLPLKIIDSDGAPARAILVEE